MSFLNTTLSLSHVLQNNCISALLSLKPYRCLVVVLLVCMFVTGCVSHNTIKTQKDGAPSLSINPESIIDAIPRDDKITRAGNKNPYTVLGKTYYLLPKSEGYKARGIASWYGTKFQGRPTANGEQYNLYAMTAAHRTLLIPTYVKVTNLDNGLATVVRVNDRGPFHNNRIIDLSYAAAVKLGFANKGTANVEIEVVGANLSSKNILSPKNDRYFLQVGAFKSIERASKLKSKLSLQLNHKITIKTSGPTGFFQVHIGPLTQLDEVQQVSSQLLALGIERPHLISQ